MDNTEKLIILGSGPAGYSASIYAARAGLNPTLITGFEVGGQLTTTTDVENWPGDYEDLQGPDLMIRMQNHAEKYGVNIVNDQIEKVDLSGEIKTLEGMNKYSCKSLIISTGASAKYLGLSSEEKYLGKGVSACATCDGFFYKNQEVVIVGGGDSACEEAHYLSKLCSKVTMLVRRDEFRASKIMQERVMKTENIEILFNTSTLEVKGDGQLVSSILTKNNITGEIKDIPATGFFVAIGHKPNTDIFKPYIDMDSTGYIINKPGSTKTNIEGVFVSGDAADHTYRQAITAAGTGCMAALDAERYLASK